MTESNRQPRQYNQSASLLTQQVRSTSSLKEDSKRRENDREDDLEGVRGTLEREMNVITLMMSEQAERGDVNKTRAEYGACPVTH